VSDRPPDDVKPEAAPWGLQAFLGERIPRTWDWKDSLGCVWIVGIGAVLTIAVWLGQLGVPSRALQVGAAAAVAGLLVAFWIIGRTGPNE
jgi:membrane associated rhomboid family serine protease